MRILPEIKNLDEEYEAQKLNEYFQQESIDESKLIKWKPVAKNIKINVNTKER